MTLPVFESTLQKTHIWLNDLMDELGTQDKHQAYLALRAVLHALRDHLSVEESAQLSAQLPMLVRGFYYEGWVPAHTPINERDKESFLNHIYLAFKTDALVEPNIRPEKVVRAVLRVLAKHVSEGELSDIKSLLPRQLRSLWPAPKKPSRGDRHDTNARKT
jgi:uncharacterized protein (DUF2267 family)